MCRLCLLWLLRGEGGVKKNLLIMREISFGKITEISRGSLQGGPTVIRTYFKMQYFQIGKPGGFGFNFLHQVQYNSLKSWRYVVAPKHGFFSKSALNE